MEGWPELISGWISSVISLYLTAIRVMLLFFPRHRHRLQAASACRVSTSTPTRGGGWEGAGEPPSAPHHGWGLRRPHGCHQPALDGWTMVVSFRQNNRRYLRQAEQQRAPPESRELFGVRCQKKK